MFNYSYFDVQAAALQNYLEQKINIPSITISEQPITLTDEHKKLAAKAGVVALKAIATFAITGALNYVVQMPVPFSRIFLLSFTGATVYASCINDPVPSSSKAEAVVEAVADTAKGVLDAILPSSKGTFWTGIGKSLGLMKR